MTVRPGTRTPVLAGLIARHPVRLVVGAAVAMLTLSACAGGASTESTTASTADTAPDMSAFSDCMADNGVTLPSGQQSGQPSGQPSARPSGAPPSGGPGAGFPGGLPDGLSQEAFDSATAACSSLMPTGGPGPGGAAGPPDDSALAAFASCLGDHDVTVADGADALAQLDRTDRTVAAALETCAPLMPSTDLLPGAD